MSDDAKDNAELRRENQRLARELAHARESLASHRLHGRKAERERRQYAEETVRRYASFDRLIARFLARLASSTLADIDEAIEDGLRQIGIFVGADRAYVVQASDNMQYFTTPYEWRADGGTLAREKMREVPMDWAPWSAAKLAAGEVVRINRLDDLPAEASADRKLQETILQKAFLDVPVRGRGGVVHGSVGLASISREIDWQDEQVRRLQAVGEAIANALERKRAEELLREAEAKYRAIFNDAAEGLFQTSPNGRFLTVNPACARICGYPSPEAMIVDVVDVSRQLYADPSDRTALLAKMETADVVHDFEYEMVCRDGSRRWVSLSLRVTRGSDGQVRHYDGTIVDIAERKRMADQLRKAQRLEFIGQMAGGVAHDFNNLLVPILGFTDVMLMRRPKDDPEREGLEQIHSAATRAKNLVQQLLAVGRKSLIEVAPFSVNDAILGFQPMLHRLIREDIAVELDLAPDAGFIAGDVFQFEQILMNLVVNARDAMPDGGTLAIETGRADLDAGFVTGHPGAVEGPHVMIVVSDTGEGMTPEVLARVFDPFFTTKGIGRGTGLGLATVFGIVRLHQGSVSAYGEPGKGSTFRVYLPRVAHGDTIEPPVDRCTDALHGTEAILVVEDDDGTRDFAALSLRNLGYEVLSAASADEALRHLADPGAKVDLLISDVILPKMNGLELHHAAVKIRPGLHVLFMSGYTSNIIAHHGVLDRGTMLIQKPFTVRDLGLKVKGALAHPAVAPRAPTDPPERQR
jgi:PAS domain S-box-containing protein